ncbi:4-oxalocrotonate tautomerase DmpI [Moritella sp.]|uniref:4-oxalocrotonate tautomerase DmpI n=1 Tax=Moritella sp. TaxID=78556 RepID=UPI001E191C1E|nr:4-oxalocrotonate tautomerase DmpI [Moritella sp.]MCJ8351574.1 tautomerase family protein [Moritella sp.]NQZ38538.1 tautomerase family protein [Moritella sp.]
MPFIAFESGQLSPEVKEQLILRLTEVSVEVTGIPKELFLVSIREQPDENIAVGGKTVKQIKQELSKK